MERNSFFEHHTYYFVELFMLLFGFSMIFVFSYNLVMQFMILMLTLFSYITFGVIHHRVKHTFSSKIMLEYILISSLILVGFIFLNFGKI